MQESITKSEIADLVAKVEEAADALMAGDVDRYLAFIHHSEDYTLLNPAGGPVRRRTNRFLFPRETVSDWDGEEFSRQMHAWYASDSKGIVA